MCLHLIHWNEKEKLERTEYLNAAGYEVVCGLPSSPAFAKQIEVESPEAMVIDLSRLPSQGREVAVMLRARKGTRSIPIVFVGGAEEKVEAIRKLLPDAAFATWESVLEELKRALASPRKEFAGVDSVFAAYAYRPLTGKLGIKPNSRVCLVGAPSGMIESLGHLPEGAQIVESEILDADLYVWFLPGIADLTAKMDAILAGSKHAPTWIAWPKKMAGVDSDLNQQTVRKLAMQIGMVDYKICSIDDKWSALLFKWRGFDD